MKNGRRKDKNLIEYYKDGQWHREDGPAVEYASGDKYWYQHGKLHRVDGPAIENSDGSKWWYMNGKRHRPDGPALEYANGNKEWFLEGVKLTEEEFNQWLDKKNLNEKLEATLPHRPITRRGKI